MTMSEGSLCRRYTSFAIARSCPTMTMAAAAMTMRRAGEVSTMTRPFTGRTLGAPKPVDSLWFPWVRCP